MDPISAPPSRLGGGRPLAWASLGKPAWEEPPGDSRVAAEAALVLVRPDVGDGVFLLHCNRAWEQLADTWHATVDEARRQAAFEYGPELAWHDLA